MLDVEWSTDVTAAVAAVARLAHSARRSRCIKLDSWADEFVTHVTTNLPEHVER